MNEFMNGFTLSFSFEGIYICPEEEEEIVFPRKLSR